MRTNKTSLSGNTYVILLIGFHGEGAVDHLSVFAGELLGGIEDGLFPVRVPRLRTCRENRRDPDTN